MKLRTWIVLGLIALVCALLAAAWPHVVERLRALHSGGGSGWHDAH